eukprot:1068850-Pyramimonas_sp.AAC.1
MLLIPYLLGPPTPLHREGGGWGGAVTEPDWHWAPPLRATQRTKSDGYNNNIPATIGSQEPCAAKLLVVNLLWRSMSRKTRFENVARWQNIAMLRRAEFRLSSKKQWYSFGDPCHYILEEPRILDHAISYTPAHANIPTQSPTCWDVRWECCILTATCRGGQASHILDGISLPAFALFRPPPNA